MKFSFGKSELEKAIERGIQNQNLEKELEDLGKVVLKRKSDGEAVVWGLQQLRGLSPETLPEQTYRLARLFQQVEPQGQAVPVLLEEGITELLSLYEQIDASADPKKSDTLMFLLKIFAMYGTTDGALKVIEAARQPLKPDGYMWSPILGSFGKGHPQNELIFRGLANPLPPGFIGMALLDAANSVAIAGETIAHPFDSKDGKLRLEAWLRQPCSEDDGYAHSATAALPFISNPEQEQLLQLAMEHEDANVRIEAAWAAAKMGKDIGLQQLAKHCLDFNTAEKAARYLVELGREDLVPAKTREPGFAALAEFSQWCAHPNELGRAPDELSVVDHRELAWPPERVPKPFSLIKFRVRDTTGLEPDDVGIGLVGSVTWSFFSREMTERPPEDCYAIHCYWEMSHAKLIQETDVRADPKEYASLLAQWSGPVLENPGIMFVAELAPELGYPQRLVGLATALRDGKQGWAVLDGEQSQWYPKNEMPQGTSDSVILSIHVGSRLLGFDGKVDRKKHLAGPPPPKAAAEVISGYEKLLEQVPELVAKKRGSVYRPVSMLREHLQAYLRALKETGRGSDVRKTFALIEPLSGKLYDLGVVAFKAGEFEIAEKKLIEHREKYWGGYYRGEKMDCLAELWFAKGKRDEVRDLLVDCLKRLLDDSKTAKGSDIDLFEQWYQQKRATLAKLFPDADQILSRAALPTTTRALA